MALSNDDIQQLITILQKGLSDSQEKPTKKKSINKKKQNIEQEENTPVMKTKSVKIKSNNHNQFLTMGVKDLHKEDTKIDKALSKFPPTPRTRKFKPVDVVCRSCGKKDSVSPSLLHDSADRYKCNKCAGSAG